MILPVQQRLRAHLRAVVSGVFGLAQADVPAIVLEYPPTRQLGDLAAPLAFELARRLRKAPRLIAQELAPAVEGLEGVHRVVAAPNGYINVFLDRPAFVMARLLPAADIAQVPPDAAPRKTIVEHTAINPNKAAHIGHLRNAALGDTLVRLLRFQGVPVEVQNYIDDTGVQVADVVVGFRELEGRDLPAIRTIADSTRFDYYCWDLYARVTDWYAADQQRLAIRTTTLHSIEQGHDESARIAAFIAARVVRQHLTTMARLNIDYDLLTWEGDILRLHFWAQAFEILQASGVVFKQTQGRLAGCWVMRIDDADDNPEGTPPIAEVPAEESSGDAREKVIVRSDGTVTYVGKDIAYQFWKFGLLGKDFHYRVFARKPDGTPLWATSSEPEALQGSPRAPAFGAAHRTYNVIDTRQSYLQKLLRQALMSMGHAEHAERSIHFSYEMVALSPATARELGYASGEDDARGFVEVSGRKGLGVKADDLLDRLAEKASAEVTARNPDLPATESRHIADMIATAAVRYFMIKYSRGKLIAFDIDEALSFEGESGPYLQYAAVRAANIFQKLRAREGVEETELISSLPDTPSAILTAAGEGDDLWNLVLEAARLDEVVDQAIRTLEPSVLAKHTFSVAQAFNGFYHRYPILNEERPDVRRWRAAAVSYCRAQLGRAIDLMGFAVPPRM